MDLSSCLYPHQLEAQKSTNESQISIPKCLINMWCGTGKTRTFTIGIFNDNQNTNIIVFPSLGLINQYCNDYILSLEEPFVNEFKKYKCLAFCSDDASKLKLKTSKIKYTTNENTLNTFLKQNKKIILVTYQSFEKFINEIIKNKITIHNLIFDEAHHIVGDNIKNIVFHNNNLDKCVEKTMFYTATPVNNNGITMYDSDDIDNSDCGPLAYKYLYYQAVEDGICKGFETQICLYTQKETYKNRFQPIFECIIRACLSGKYDYWNVLTYHSFVNEKENTNEGISFVKDFACKQNQDLVKKVFTKIQNEEFPSTKNLYSVNDVILKGVHSNTPKRQNIIDDFDKKVIGRIIILASCGILNEGIDTKWANMGVPINPSNSIVKESQRIGRLSRIPEQDMTPAVILIPCMVDATKYASIDTAEQRDQMIREELSKCGNFNTAMNVISAFKYQYDPELFEMCLMYPNKYAPQEVKSNLEKQGLVVEESKGDLLANLSYVCEKEDFEIDTESFEGYNDRDILDVIAEQTEKTIEIHTQNHDEPIVYINGEVSDEEPLRLFLCEDDKTYAPIVKKDKKQNIKRKSTSPPKKRSTRLFDVHTHPDLEVLWNISKSSIDLNKSFSQGILDVNITHNEKKWMEYYDILKKLDNMPSQSYVTECGINIGCWCNKQRQKKKKNILSQDKYDLLEKIPGWFWERDLDGPWMEYYDILKKLDNMPSQSYVTEGGIHIGCWCATQRTNKKKNKLSDEQINLLDKIPDWFWERDLDGPWMDKYNILKELDNMPSSTYVNESGINIGSWCARQRTINKKNKLSDKQIHLLEKIPGWFWELELDEQWNENYNILINLNNIPLQTYVTESGINIGNWCATQRAYKKKEKLSQCKIDLLEKIPGWYWELNLDDKWMEQYDILKELDNMPSSTYVNESGINIGMWVTIQRTNKKKNILSQERIDLLEKIPGWIWERDIDGPWMENYNILKKIDKTPPENHVTKSGINIGSWISIQRQKKKKNMLSDEQINLLDKIPGWFWERDLDGSWMKNYNILKELDNMPTSTYVNESGINIGRWCGKQRDKKKKNKLSDEQINLLENIPGWFWEKRVTKDMSKPDIKPKTENEIQYEKKAIINKSEMSELHQKYKSMTSANLYDFFKNNPSKWNDYHKLSKDNEKSFPEDEIPRNNMIKYLEDLPGKKEKVIADLGCGSAEINQHFKDKDNTRFKFHNFDHHSSNELVTSIDIKYTGLDPYTVDIVILSLAMWGSNCEDYLSEAYRILDIGGTLLIAEPYKRWNDLDEQHNTINRLVALLETESFKIEKKIEKKFMFIECRKLNKNMTE